MVQAALKSYFPTASKVVTILNQNTQGVDKRFDVRRKTAVTLPWQAKQIWPVLQQQDVLPLACFQLISAALAHCDIPICKSYTTPARILLALYPKPK